MPMLLLHTGKTFTFPRPQFLITVIAQHAGQENGDCEVRYQDQQQIEYEVPHSGRPPDECLIRALTEGNQDIPLLSIDNTGNYDIVVTYSS